MRDFIQEITREAGQIVAEKFGKIGIHHTKKDPTDVVTEADILSNEHLTKRISAAYPTHHILSEEGDTTLTGTDYEWIVDPLDGTRNFATRTPLFGVLVALVHQGKVIMAAIAQPMTQELFFAEAGKGAFKNGEKISCSTHTTFEDSFGLIGSNQRSQKRVKYNLTLFKKGLTEPFWVSAFGSTAISGAYTADGRRDWYVNEGSSIWDYAAPVLIMREAGCLVTTASGKNWELGDPEIIAANPTLHPKILAILNA